MPVACYQCDPRQFVVLSAGIVCKRLLPGWDMARTKTWALVTNGVRARIFRNLDNGDSEEPIEVISKAESTHLRDIMSDKPGRSFSSGAGGRRSAMEPGSDPVYREMQDFAQKTLSALETHRRAGRFNRLAIFAAPKMLGILRREMPPALREVVVLEKGANLIGLPEADLRKLIRKDIGEEPLI